jgi:hypothetical protein
MGVKVRDVVPTPGAICALGPLHMGGNPAKWRCACVADGKYACEDGSDGIDAGSQAHLQDLIDANKRAAGPNWLAIGAIAAVAVTATVYFMRN